MFWVYLACVFMGIIGGTSPIWWEALQNFDHFHKYGEWKPVAPSTWAKDCRYCHKSKYYSE